MTSPVFYILVALTFTSAIISSMFFLAWKTLGNAPYALSWSIAFLAATIQWAINLGAPLFPNWETYWLVVNAPSLVVVTLGLRGHCQRTNLNWLPTNLWPFAFLVYAAIVWTTVVEPHIGLSTALLPGTAALTLFISAAMIVRHRERTRPAEWGAAMIVVFVGVTQGAAAGVALFQGIAGDPEYRQLYMHVNFMTLPAGYAGMAIFVVFMLASDLSEELKELAVRDQLTGLLNRRGFNERAEPAFMTARRSDQPISVVMSDVDRFKKINDALGHGVGDAALVHFANVLRHGRRGGDILARVGGEEFAIVLPGADIEQALELADRLCADLAAAPMDTDDHGPLYMTASFGVAMISERDTCLSDLVSRADQALYRSKRAGRNRVDLESSQIMRLGDGSLSPLSS